MDNKTRINKYTIALATFTAMITLSSAATIAWGEFDLDAAASEISTKGTLVEALNLVNTDAREVTDTTTINGVIFTANNLFNSSVNTDFGVRTGEANLDLLFQQAGISVNPVTLTGLTIGDKYELQTFLGYANVTFKMSVGDGTTIQKTSSGSVENGVWIIGTFTADATTQIFQSRLENSPQNFISGYQLRDISSVPEPSSTALIGLGGLALILRRSK